MGAAAGGSFKGGLPRSRIPSESLNEAGNDEISKRAGFPESALPPYRHSRVSGNPEAAGRQRSGLFSTVLDSRLRGNDGRGRAGKNGEDGKGRARMAVGQVAIAAAIPPHPTLRRRLVHYLRVHFAAQETAGAVTNPQAAVFYGYHSPQDGHRRPAGGFVTLPDAVVGDVKVVHG